MKAFLDDEDHRTFIGLLAEAANVELSIWAYVLMPNHLHLIAVPARKDSIGLAAGRSLLEYERRFVRKYGVEQPLWKPRLYFSVLDRQAFLWKAVRYVERNPLRAGLAARPEQYPWSSAAHHCGLRPDDPLVAPDSPLEGAIHGWTQWLAEPDPWPRNDVRRDVRPRFVRAAD
jgi:putative transposase